MPLRVEDVLTDIPNNLSSSEPRNERGDMAGIFRPLFTKFGGERLLFAPGTEKQ
jgi:hypothetical protein